MADRRKPRHARSNPSHRTGRVAAALRFAVAAHLDQTRKDRRTPYIVHPVAVMRVLSSELAVTEPDILCAALLHDILEDTHHTAAQLRSRFGSRVTRWVEELTIPAEFHGPAVSDSAKTALLVRAVGRISWPAVLIKLADRLDNLRDITNALWSPTKRRRFRAQTREILSAVDRRTRSDPPPPGLAKPLTRGRHLVRERLRLSRPET